MQRFAVIGLGRFGSRLAAGLASAGQEVIAIDLDERIVEQLRDRVTVAVAMDSTNEKALEAHGLDKVDAAVVCMGSAFEANALTTVILKQYGVERVISRAATPTSARILARIGADEVVNPEDGEMLEDVGLTAVREAQTKAQEMASKLMGNLTGGLNIPGLT